MSEQSNALIIAAKALICWSNSSSILPLFMKKTRWHWNLSAWYKISLPNWREQSVFSPMTVSVVINPHWHCSSNTFSTYWAAVLNILRLYKCLLSLKKLCKYVNPNRIHLSGLSPEVFFRPEYFLQVRILASPIRSKRSWTINIT